MAASINIKVNSDFPQAQKDLERFGKASASVQKRMEQFSDGFKTEKIDDFIVKNKRSSAAIMATRGPLAAMETEYKGLQREIERLIRRGLDPQDEKMQKLRVEYDRLQKEMSETNSQQKKNNSTQQTSIKNLAAMAAGVFSVAQATAALKAASTNFMDYSKSIANVNTLIDISDEEFKKLDETLSSLSTEFAVQKTELSSGVYQALSAGAEDLGAALNIVEQSAILSKGALIDNSAAVDIVTTAMNSYESGTVSAADAIDTYFTIVKEGKINGEELSQTIGKSISLFAAAKLPLKELGAGISTLTKVGVPAAEATTQLNAIVNAFLKPSEQLTKSIEEYGYASGSALLESEGLGGALEFLQSASGGSLDEIAQLVPSIRGLRGALAAGAEDGAVFNDILAEFENQAGAAQTALEKQTGGFAEASFEFEKMKIQIQNISIEIGQKLVTGFVNAIKVGQNLSYVLGGVTIALVGFLVVAKGAVIINALSVALTTAAVAFRGLTAAMAANPIGVLVVAITAVLIPAIIWLVKNWDLVVVIMSTTIEKLKERFSSFAATISMLWTKAISGIQILFLELAGIVLNKVLGAVNAFLDVAKELPFVGDKFADVQGTVNGLAGELDEARVAAINQSRDAVAAAEAQQAAVKRQTTENLARIEEEKQARLAALDTVSSENAKMQEEQEKAQEGHEQNITDIQTTALSSRLEVLNNVEAQARIDNLATFDEFLSARMEQEAIAGENRVAFLQEELDRIRELTNISAEERVAAEATVAEQIKQIQDEQRASEAAARVAQIKGYADMFGTMSNIMSVFAGENEAAASGMKMLAAAQAGINSYLAFTQVLADPTLPFLVKAISATSVLASGLAQQKNIMSTSVSAETGGEFTVPDSGRVDSAALMVNQGEKVAVTPRGETSSSSTTTNVYVDKEMIWSVVQDGLDQNEINVTNDNVRSA